MALLPRKEIKTIGETIPIEKTSDNESSTPTILKNLVKEEKSDQSSTVYLGESTTHSSLVDRKNSQQNISSSIENLEKEKENTISTATVQNFAEFEKSATALPESATVKNLIESEKNTEQIVESTTGLNLVDRKNIETSEVLPGVTSSVNLEQLSQNVEQLATAENVSEPIINISLVDQKKSEPANTTISELTSSTPATNNNQKNIEIIETSTNSQTVMKTKEEIIDPNDNVILTSTPSNEESTSHQSLVDKINSENLLEATTARNVRKSLENLENVSTSGNPIESSTLQSLIDQVSDIERGSSISQLVQSTTPHNLVDQKINTTLSRKTSESEINIGAKNTLTEIETKLRTEEEQLLENLRKAERKAEKEIKKERVEALQEITNAKEKLKYEVAKALKNIEEIGKKAKDQLKNEESRIVASLAEFEKKLKSEKNESLATTNETVRTSTTIKPIIIQNLNKKNETQRKSSIVEVSNSTDVKTNGTKVEHQLKKEESPLEHFEKSETLIKVNETATSPIPVTTEKPKRESETQRKSLVVEVSNSTDVPPNKNGTGTGAGNQLKKEKIPILANLTRFEKSETLIKINETATTPIPVTTENPNKKRELQRKSLVIVVPDTIDSQRNETKTDTENNSKKDEKIQRIEKVAERLELTAESLARTQEKLKPQPTYIKSKDLLKIVARAGRNSKVYPAIVVDNQNGERDILVEDKLGVRSSVFLKSDLAKLIADNQISKISDQGKRNNDELY